MVTTFLTGLTRKWIFWVLVDLWIFLVFALIAPHSYPAQKQMDYQLSLSTEILNGQIPYVDFSSEYPPLALLSYLLPALLFRSPATYYLAFVIEMLLFDLLAMVLIKKISSRLGISVPQALSVHALVIIAVGPIMAVTYDMVPAVLVLAAVAFFISGRTNIAWAFVGLGLMTKLYPIIVGPFFVLYQLRQTQYRRAAQGVVIFISVVLALSLPWLLLNAKGYLDLFTYHLERGLHSESTYGLVLLLGKVLGLVQVQGVYSFGSWNLASPLADQLARLSFVIMAGLLGIVYLLYTRVLLRGTRDTATDGLQPAAAATLLRYVAAAVLIFILFAKVFSAQYLVWLCPLLPLITGHWRIALYACFVVAGAFTQFVYPYNYRQFEANVPPLVVMMLVRSVLLMVGTVFVLLPEKQRLNSIKSTFSGAELSFW